LLKNCSANDICLKDKRSKITAQDVMAALVELELGDFAQTLTSVLEGLFIRCLQCKESILRGFSFCDVRLVVCRH